MMKIKDIISQKASVSLKFLIVSVSIKNLKVSQGEKQMLNCLLNDGTAMIFGLLQLTRKNEISQDKTFEVQNAKAQDINGILYLTFGPNSKIKASEDLKLMSKRVLVNVSQEYQKMKLSQNRQTQKSMTRKTNQTKNLTQAEKQFMQYTSSRSNSRSIHQSQQRGNQNSIDKVDQNSQRDRSQNQKSLKQQQQRGQPKYKRMDLDIFNDFINELYWKMEQQSLNFTRCKQHQPILDQFCDMPLQMTEKQIQQIVDYEMKWGKDNRRAQSQIDYVIRVRIFQENFEKCRQQMKQKLLKQKRYVQRTHLIDRTGSYPTNRNFKPQGKGVQKTTKQRELTPPRRNKQRVEAKQQGKNNEKEQNNSREQC